MSHDSLQSQYALKDLIRRLFFAGIVINASLSLSGQLITVANALAGAFLGDGASAAASTGLAAERSSSERWRVAASSSPCSASAAPSPP